MIICKNNINEIGIDESGRGPLLGRIYVGAVVWKKNLTCDIINDSKKLTPKKRQKALQWIENNIDYYSYGYASEKEIDDININNATILAINRAIDNLKDFNLSKELIIDGINWENKFDYPCTSIVKGDQKYYSIAAASIIAKEYHDRYINDLCINNNILNEKYFLNKNKGYGTKQHLEGLKKFGPCEYHRLTFIKKYI